MREATRARIYDERGVEMLSDRIEELCDGDRHARAVAHGVMLYGRRQSRVFHVKPSQL